MIQISNVSDILEGKIKNILNHDYKFFLNKPNVVGIALGYKRQNNFYTHKKCIQTFVCKKISKFKLFQEQLIPSYYKGIPTDVVESSIFTACSLTKRIRPVVGGYSISASMNEEYGTCGCLVTNGVLKFLLSTNHTIANENSLAIGTPIIQPANKYGGFHPNDTIGTLHKFMPLRFVEEGMEPINFSDSAIALLSEPSILTPEITYIGKLQGVKSPILNEEVKKVGATTELTHGRITNTNGITQIILPSGRRGLFKNLIFTTKMIDKGDSGAILINKYNYGLGMTFAGSNAFSVFCNLNIVLDQLGVQLVT